MTDNEIIKALENFSCVNCDDNCWREGEHDINCPQYLAEITLDLINRQKAEIEKFKNRQKPTAASGYKIENGKVVFFTNMLGGCKVVKENLDEVVKTLNELLQECYSKDEIAFALKCKTEELKTAKAEAVKEFAEKVKKHSYFDHKDQRNVVAEIIIDHYLKERVGEDK